MTVFPTAGLGKVCFPTASLRKALRPVLLEACAATNQSSPYSECLDCSQYGPVLPETPQETNSLKMYFNLKLCFLYRSVLEAPCEVKLQNRTSFLRMIRETKIIFPLAHLQKTALKKNKLSLQAIEIKHSDLIQSTVQWYHGMKTVEFFLMENEVRPSLPPFFHKI